MESARATSCSRTAGRGIYACVTPKGDHEPSDELHRALKLSIRELIGPIATPDVIQVKGWASAQEAKAELVDAVAR